MRYNKTNSDAYIQFWADISANITGQYPLIPLLIPIPSKLADTNTLVHPYYTFHRLCAITSKNLNLQKGIILGILTVALLEPSKPTPS